MRTERNALPARGTAAAAPGLAPALSGADAAPRKRLGIGMYSYSLHWKLAREKHPALRFSDTLQFLQHTHRLGGGGVQVSLGSRDLARAAQVRAYAEANGLYFEGNAVLPKDERDTARFVAELRALKEAGAVVVRTALLSGRRYETFASADDFRRFREQSWRSLTLAEPVLKHYQLRLAVENHKDWLVPELLDLLQRLSSERVGVCLDTGNSIALLESAMAVVGGLAPFAFSTHLKDMGVQEYEDGFLLSEVPLGDGFLDLKRITALLLKANPAIQFNLEMITRDPLQIPCLTDKYWATMDTTPASRLAAALSNVKQHAASKPLPRTTGLSVEEQLGLEDENVRKSLAFARSQLGL